MTFLLSNKLSEHLFLKRLSKSIKYSSFKRHIYKTLFCRDVWINIAESKNQYFDEVEYLSLFAECGSDSEPLDCGCTTRSERQIGFYPDYFSKRNSKYKWSDYAG